VGGCSVDIRPIEDSELLTVAFCCELYERRNIDGGEDGNVVVATASVENSMDTAADAEADIEPEAVDDDGHVDLSLALSSSSIELNSCE
jgi:hypothetical protein